ncbi:MAG: antitoxin component YwqK of YwqJK toxin-antitoxin module [Chlamydiales bacterium]|jgi:antitoxin component YwqK of YwqJK toxin-antitoxin module
MKYIRTFLTSLLFLQLPIASASEDNGTVAEVPPTTGDEFFPPVQPGDESDRKSIAQKITRRVYYPNGSLEKIETLTRSEGGDFVEHGVEVQFYPNGKFMSRGLIVQGKQSGKWVFVDESGEIRQGEFQNGERSGTWKLWSPEKQLLLSEQFIGDQLHGPRRTYHQNGKSASSAFYSYGIKQGTETFWHPNGNKAVEVHWVNGQRHGRVNKWAGNGQIFLDGNYFMGLPEGNWGWRDLDGRLLKSTTFKDGTGALYDYAFVKLTNDDEGRMLLQLESSYKDGKLDGVETTYHKNGNLRSEYHYEGGRKNGKFREWFTGGYLKVEGQNSNDKPSGVIKEYYPPDPDESVVRTVLHKETTYIEGKDKATLIEYSPKGLKTSVRDLKDGQSHGSVQEYYDDGTLKLTGSFINGLKDGEWKEFFQDGNERFLYNYTLDKLNGKYKSWHEVIQPVLEEGVEAPEEKPTATMKEEGAYSNGQKEGPWQTWYSNDSLQSQVPYQNGLEDGNYKEWWPKYTDSDEDAILKAEGDFVLGNKNGIWQTWHANGLMESKNYFENGVRDGVQEVWYEYLIRDEPVLKLRGEYKKGKKHGQGLAYFADSKLEILQTYDMDQLEGPYEEYYSTGILKSIGSFSNGVLEGDFKVYHPNKKLKEEHYYTGGHKDGSYATYHEKGKLESKGRYRRDIPVGLWQWFDEDGKTILASSNFEDGRGTMYEFYPNGQKKVEVEYVDGMKHGREIRWYREGVIRSETLYHRGLINGSRKEFHESGQRLTESTWIYGRRNGTFLSWYGNQKQQMSLYFVDDVPHGQMTEWYENGKLKATGTWVQGKRNGDWSWFDRYGQKILLQNYDIGILVSTEREVEASSSE